MDIGIRTAGNPALLAPAATAAIHTVDPEQPVMDMCTLETLRHRDSLGLNYVAVMMAVFGALALVLAAVGVYGVMAYLVSEQTHEIGIRMALGARRETVLAMVLRRGLLTAAAGLAIGLAVSYQMARLLASLVWGVTAGDPVSFTAIPLALIVTAALAVSIPAMRATRIDPVVALRNE
jgi:putative ABC transport system permease protein